MVKKKVTVVLFHDDEVGGYSVIIPTIPNLATMGDSVEHAFAMAKECLELSLYDLDGSDYYNLNRVYADHVAVGTITVTAAPDRSAGDSSSESNSSEAKQAPVEQKATVVLLRDQAAHGYTAITPMFPSYWIDEDEAIAAFSVVKQTLETVLRDGDDWDPYDLAYSYTEHVVVGTVELELPVVPGPDWKFFDKETGEEIERPKANFKGP
jgi:predicted RNase H-like HicB family nuclease